MALVHAHRREMVAQSIESQVENAREKAGSRALVARRNDLVARAKSLQKALQNKRASSEILK
jgi:hypothetical protein